MEHIGFDPEVVRAALRPLDLATPPAPTEQEQAYFAHYGIDFEAQQPDLTHHFGCYETEVFSIAAHHWEVPSSKRRGTAVVVHGYFDHVGLYGHLIRFCLDAGFSVFAFDLPGHGLSSGPRAHIERFEHYDEALVAGLDLLEAHEHRGASTRPWVLMGQSTGGAVGMYHLNRHGYTLDNSPFASTVLFAPLVRPSNWARDRWKHAIGRYFVDSQPREFSDNSGDPDFLRFLRESDPLQPRLLAVPWVTALKRWLRQFDRLPASQLDPLVIQGQQDGTVDWRFNVPYIGRKFAGTQVHFLPEARHHLVNESAPLREQMFDAVAQYLDR